MSHTTDVDIDTAFDVFSAALGCYLDADFVKKPFANDENHCQDTAKVPFPLPKIGK